MAKFGTPAGTAAVPAEAAAEDTSRHARVIGTGTPASCTSQAVLDGGGLITLSGRGQHRVLDQGGPRLVVQNITLADGDSTGDETDGSAAPRSAWPRQPTTCPSTSRTARSRAVSAPTAGR
ncbi:hypothetical protein [Lentzea albida]|uniref:hypothetical protein n=1 Tax=Lentzea albida TaxID=65499 RepID=UPI000B7EE607|nr:hypothetical protein [Lentzea albida]